MDQSTLYTLGWFAIFFGIMYFLMIRPQQKQAKQRKAMLSSLKVKDKIITAGGIYGKISKVKDDSVMVQIADKVEIEVSKSGIANVLNREVVVEKDKKNDKEKEKAEKDQQKDSNPNDKDQEVSASNEG